MGPVLDYLGIRGVCLIWYIFFFSSRRRHTRLQGDWSSDVCSSDLLGEHGQGTILFLDEVHRFNKAQQDALLPAVEDGTLTLVGATTENPFFEVNPRSEERRVGKECRSRWSPYH